MACGGAVDVSSDEEPNSGLIVEVDEDDPDDNDDSDTGSGSGR